MPTTREKELDLFLDNLLSVAYGQYCQTAQHQRELQQWEQIEGEMDAVLSTSQRLVVERWLAGLLEAEGHKQSHAYRQGLRDMVFLLRRAGVLA